MFKLAFKLLLSCYIVYLILNLILKKYTHNCCFVDDQMLSGDDEVAPPTAPQIQPFTGNISETSFCTWSAKYFANSLMKVSKGLIIMSTEVHMLAKG